MQKHLVKIANETIEMFPEIKDHCGDKLIKGIENTTYYHNLDEIKQLTKNLVNNKYETKIDVVDMDTVDCAIDMCANDLNPLVLNMASDRTPCGGFKSGARAQEEEISRRSTNYLSLKQNKISGKYPLPKKACIYCPNVFIFRAGKDDDYALCDWDECVYLAFIAIAAVRKPKLVDDKMAKVDEELTINKIRTMFEVARLHDHDSLVLGAHGCGAFGCPPKHMAELFKQVIAEYDGEFKQITFAIITDHNDKHGNYKIFRETLVE